MASGTANSPGPMVVGSHANLQHDQFIEQQLARTRRRVKWVDLGSLAMGLVGGIIAYLLIVVLIDHWVAGLSGLGRFVALLGLLLGTTYYLAAYLVPPFLRRINPAYAARAIEQSDPSLKNSLINFLMFRRDATPTNRLVYQALRHRAATDLRDVNIDLAVDRTKLIRVGYVVVALMVLFAVYTIVSPKDVFQTMRRVAAPWAHIARPSRVSISDVRVGAVEQPLDAPVELVFGDQPTISARIQGVRAEESVTLYYSTLDRQTVDREVRMEPGDAEQRFQCQIPPKEDQSGLQQNVEYSIRAGDAELTGLKLLVSPTPTIVVEEISYDCPAYTRLKREPVKNNGEISGLEGTRVTIRARANHPIKSARIEFNPDSPTEATDQRIEDFNGTSATYDFLLKFKDDERRVPEFRSYRLSFMAENGHLSKDSMIYHIAVSRDLPPEIEILAPRDQDLELAADATQRIEIRAIDPDFALSSVSLCADASGRGGLVNEKLPIPPQGLTGQATLTYNFSPRQLGLVPGDKVTYYAVAEDNRTSLQDRQSPDPNRVRTSDYVLTIVGAKAAPAGGEGNSSEQPNGDNAPQRKQPGESGSEADARQQPGDPTKSAESSPSSEQDQAGEQGNQGDSQPPQSGEQGNKSQQQQQSGDSQQGEQGQEGQQGQTGQEGQQGQTGQAGQQGQTGQEGQQGQTGQAGQQGQSSESGQTGAPSSGSSSAGETGDPSPSGSQGASAGQSAGSSAGTNSQQDSGGGSPSSGNSQGQQPGGGTPQPGSDSGGSDNATPEAGQAGRGDSPTPASRPEPLHDGEAFERALEYLEKSAGGSPQNDSGGSDSASSTDAQGSQPKATDGSGDPAAQANSAVQANPAAAQNDAGGAEQAEKPGADVPGQGENSDPRGGAGEQGADDRTPKGVEGQESTQNADSGPLDKQPGLGDEGQAGSGESSDSPQGAPAAQQANADRDKTSNDPNREKSNDSGDQEPPSPSVSKKQSDSQGEGSGDESGGGKKGGGQSANQPGRDSAGSNMSSDQGNTGSPESGQGETADRGGDKKLAPGPTGQAGQTPGSGSQTQDSSQGQDLTQQGARPQQPGAPSNAAQGSQDPQAQRSSPPENNSTGGVSSGPPQGGGLPGPDGPDVTPSLPDPPPAAADPANLEYSRKATDLVLERLKNQQQDPDPELLKSLGWTKEEMQQFIARWEELKRSAHEEGPQAQADLDDALRSLGLRATRLDVRRGSAENDQQRGQSESGIESHPPTEFREQFNAYKKGAVRGDRERGGRRP